MTARDFLYEKVIPKLPWILLIGLPLGAGSQNIALATASVVLLADSFKRRSFRFPGHAVLMAVGLCWLAVVTMVNPANPGHRILGHLLGYTPLLLLPSLLPSARIRCHPRFWQTAVLIIVSIAIIALTQYIWGWQRVGFSLVAGEQRARGTWTHPLTLAYAALLLLPFATGWLLKQPRLIWSWLFFLAEILIIWTSRSRIVILVSVGLLGIQFFLTAGKRTRLMLIAVLAVCVLTVALTDNDLSRHFRQTFSGQVDRHTQRYPDDRVAFWHAYAHLALKRPWVGHGIHIPKEIRRQAYADIGLADFPKQYSAHNQYLQFFAEGGLPALMWFCMLLGYWWYQCWFYRHKLIATWLALSLLGFALGLFTQNAFQDNEVRYVLTLLLCWAAFQFTNSEDVLASSLPIGTKENPSLPL